MNFDEEEYLEEDEESLEETEDIVDDNDSNVAEAEYSDGDFSYEQNSFNPYSPTLGDVNNIKSRINNKQIVNNNASKIDNAGKTMEKGSELAPKEGLTKKEDIVSEGVHQVAKEAAGKAAEAYAGKTAGKLAEKAVDSEIGREITDKIAKKGIKNLKLHIALWAAGIFFGLMLFIGVICVFAFGFPAAIFGIDMGEVVSGMTSYSPSSGSGTISNKSYLWPIGSKETIETDGITLAIGNPVSINITSEYGKRKDPITHNIRNHNGIDIGSVKAGETNVIAASSGIVVKIFTNCKSYGDASCGGGYGNHIMISHNDGRYTLYAHLHQNSITVKKNEKVKSGQVIAKTGSSGRSTGAHLHFEVRTSVSSRTNPLDYVDPKNPRPTSFNSISGL